MNELQSITQLFQNRLFRIPDYQRGYAWKREQLADFWDDLTNLQMDRYHYTGLLSLKSIPHKDVKGWHNDIWLVENGYRPCHVVDGQQRLTTIAILLNEIVNFLKILAENLEKTDEDIVIGYETIKDIRAKYISRRRPPHGIITSYLFGYETDNPSADYLQYRIFGEPFAGDVEETYYTKNLKYAKEFFVDCLKQLYIAEGIQGIENSYKKLTQKMMFNIHEIEDDYDVFVAFETMNNRGKKLTSLELLKNRLIYLTTLYDDHKLDINDKSALRKKINNSWKEVYYQLGRNQSISLSDDDFLRAHWILFFQYSRKKGDDYIRFLLDKFSAKNIFEKQVIPLHEDTVANSVEPDIETDDSVFIENEADVFSVSLLEPKEIDAYVMSLNETAMYWYYTFFPYESDFSDDEKLWIDRLNRIGIGYFRPMVTASLTPSANATSEERIALFKEIERFIFVDFRLGTFQSSYQSSDYYRKTKDIFMGNASLTEVANNIRDITTKDVNAALSNFNTRISKRFDSGEGFYGWRDLRYLLYEYEHQLAVRNKLQKVDWSLFSRVEKDKITIEHILPQTPTKWYWRNQFRAYTQIEIKTISCSLGNLLLLSQSINSGLQNDSFSDKKETSSLGRRGYSNGSHSEIEVSNATEWTAGHVLERGLQLLRFMEKRWNINFAGEVQMKELLHLKFMDEPREDIPRLSDVTVNVVPEPTMKDEKYSTSTETEELRTMFWDAFVKYCKLIGRENDIGCRKPGSKYSYDVQANSSSYFIFFNLIGKDTLRIGLYIYSEDVFLWLENQKEQIEQQCGFHMDWYSSHEKSIAKRILFSTNTDISDITNFKFCFDWLIEHFDHLVKALHTVVLDDTTTRKVSSSNGKITNEMVEVAYIMAQKVHSEKLSRINGRDEIVRLRGMNSASAGGYINTFLAMMNGNQYKWTMNEYSTRYYLEHIRKDYGEDSYRKALSACRQHAKYYATLGNGRLAYIERIVEESKIDMDRS